MRPGTFLCGQDAHSAINNHKAVTEPFGDTISGEEQSTSALHPALDANSECLEKQQVAGGSTHKSYLHVSLQLAFFDFLRKGTGSLSSMLADSFCP